LHQQGPRADEAHLTAQNVNQGRQLVDGGGAQPAAQGCEALGIWKESPAGIAGAGHGAELQEPEGPAAVTGALLAEQHRRTQAQSSKNGNNN